MVLLNNIFNLNAAIQPPRQKLQRQKYIFAQNSFRLKLSSFMTLPLIGKTEKYQRVHIESCF